MAKLDVRLKTLKVGATFTSPPEVTLAAISAELVRAAGGAATLEVQASKPAGDFRPFISPPEQDWAAGFLRVGDFVFRISLVPCPSHLIERTFRARFFLPPATRKPRRWWRRPAEPNGSRSA